MNLNYFRCIAGVDDNVGKVLDALDRLKLAENTVVVYASDNGFYLGEHTLADKRSGYDESLRIPLIVRYPKSGLKGVTRDDMVLNIDLAPTFLDLAGVAVPKDMHGKSWKPLLAKEAPKEPFRASFFYEYFREAGAEEGRRAGRGRVQHADDDRRPHPDAQAAQVPRPPGVDRTVRPRRRPVRDEEPVRRPEARRGAGRSWRRSTTGWRRNSATRSPRTSPRNRSANPAV